MSTLRILGASACLVALAGCARHEAARDESLSPTQAAAPASTVDLEQKLSAALALAEKGGPRPDDLLDQFEQVVVQFEAISGQISIDQVGEISQANVDYAQRVQEWQNAGIPVSPDQRRRLADLQSRLARVLERAAGVSAGT